MIRPEVFLLPALESSAFVGFIFPGRLYLGAHWLTDVLGGWALGTLWFLLVLAASQAVAGRQATPDPAAPSVSTT